MATQKKPLTFDQAMASAEEYRRVHGLRCETRDERIREMYWQRMLAIRAELGETQMDLALHLCEEREKREKLAALSYERACRVESLEGNVRHLNALMAFWSAVVIIKIALTYFYC